MGERLKIDGRRCSRKEQEMQALAVLCQLSENTGRLPKEKSER